MVNVITATGWGGEKHWLIWKRKWIRNPDWLYCNFRIVCFCYFIWFFLFAANQYLCSKLHISLLTRFLARSVHRLYILAKCNQEKSRFGLDIDLKFEFVGSFHCPLQTNSKYCPCIANESSHSFVWGLTQLTIREQTLMTFSSAKNPFSSKRTLHHPSISCTPSRQFVINLRYNQSRSVHLYRNQ